VEEFATLARIGAGSEAVRRFPYSSLISQELPEYLTHAKNDLNGDGSRTPMAIQFLSFTTGSYKRAAWL
jgi:hypothetical protein